MSQHVKRARTYDASKRRADAAARRERVLSAARTSFLRDGFAATTIAAVAEQADVSTETVYKNFGGKSGLVRALYDDALRGEGPTPAFQRSDELRAEEDGMVIVRGWSRLATEVAPRVSPLLLLVRDAALVQADLRPLLDELDDLRHKRMIDNARFLADAGHLRQGVDVEAAADLMWAVTSPELYEMLVVRRGWSIERYADHVFHTVSSLLHG